MKKVKKPSRAVRWPSRAECWLASLRVKADDLTPRTYLVEENQSMQLSDLKQTLCGTWVHSRLRKKSMGGGTERQPV